MEVFTGGGGEIRSPVLACWRDRRPRLGAVAPPPFESLSEFFEYLWCFPNSNSGSHWRRGRDSNSRFSCENSGFQDRRTRPLCDPSTRKLYLKIIKIK